MRIPYVALGVTSLAVAGVHFAVMGSHFDEFFLFGLFFSVVAWLQALWAIVIVLAPGRRLLLAGVVGNLAIALIWVLTRTTGLPIGPEAGTPEAVGFADVLATALELLIAGGSALLFVSHPPTRFVGGRAGRWAVLALTVALMALTTAAIATVGGGEHGHGSAAGVAEPEVIEVDLGSGREMRAFVDTPSGVAQLHLTFFAEDGTELPVSSPVVDGTSPSGEDLEIASTRFGPGHFVSTADLEHGEWEVRVTASIDGERLMGTFEIHVEEGPAE